LQVLPQNSHFNCSIFNGQMLWDQ